MGFWIMMVAFFAAEYREFVQKHKEKPTNRSRPVGPAFVFFYLTHQAVMLQWETVDYHLRGASA